MHKRDANKMETPDRIAFHFVSLRRTLRFELAYSELTNLKIPALAEIFKLVQQSRHISNYKSLSSNDPVEVLVDLLLIPR